MNLHYVICVWHWVNRLHRDLLSFLLFYWNIHFIHFLLVVNYSLNLTSKLHYFGHIDGCDGKIQFRFREEFSLCHQGSSKEHFEKILSPSFNTMREFMTDAIFKGKNRWKMRKPHFLFRDKIKLLGDCFLDGNYKWLRQVHWRYMFLPNMEW